MPRTKLRKGLTQTSKEEGGSTTRTTAQIEKYYSGGKRPFSYKKNDRGKIVKIPQMLTGGQAKIAAKAPPPNKIDAKDFAVLRAEKAKGRGMGLQDESVKPGKVMKAKRGKMFDGYLSTFDASSKASTPKNMRGVTTIVGVKPGSEIGKGKKKFKSMEEMRKAKGFKTIDGKQETSSQFNKRRTALAGAKQVAKSTRLGKILLPIVGAGVAAKTYLNSKMKKDKNKKTLKDFREQKKPGVPSEKTKTINSALNKLNKKMGGGMMQRPMGYAVGGPISQTTSGTMNIPRDKDGKNIPKRQRRAGPPGKEKKRKAGLGALGGVGGKKEKINIIITKGGAYTYNKPKIDEKKGRHFRQHKTYDASPRLISDAQGKTTSLRSMNAGGMTKPMGYKSGTSVKVKCKLGRNKPTKMY